MATKKQKVVVKKKAPPGQARRAKAKMAAMTQALTLAAEPTIDPATLSRDYIRHAAGLHYVTDLEGMSVRKMAAEHPIYSSIPEKTLEKWMLVDKWAERRKAFFDELQLKITKKIGDSLVQQHVTMLQDVQQIENMILERLRPVDHPYLDEEAPNGERRCATCGKPFLPFHEPFFGVSGDKAVTALVKLMEAKRDMMAELMQSVLPVIQASNAGRSSSSSPVPVDPSLSQDEARAAALEILRIRRERLRAARKDL